MKQTMNKEDLIKMGYNPYTAVSIIRQANTQLFSKSNLVHCLLTVDFKTFFSSPRITS